MPPLRKILLVSTGLICVGLATAGLFLPLLPTTPFLLLAAACFARGSDRWYRWLIGHPGFGPFIRNYREHRALPRHTKIAVLTLLWVALGFGVVFVLEALFLRILMGIIGTAVTVHILRFRTLTPDMLRAERDAESPMD